MVGANINSGASLILYTGHGSNTSWSSSGFSSTNVNTLTNNGKLPFIWSVACVNGNFVGTTCFAEAWLRATNNNEPSGAIATLMSTINQSWSPPMEGQDEMVDILVESYANNIKRTFGGLSMNGCMKMNDTYGSGGNEMTDTWTCFGDPSVVVRTAVPQTMIVSHNPVILMGSGQFTVNCNVADALVCLTIDNQIIGTATVSGGSATITFAPLMNIATATIAVTAYNYIPYLGTADIVPASGPFINFSGYDINDPAGNNNGEADYGEDLTLDVTLENAGSDPAYNVSGTLTSSDIYVSITDDTQSWGTIMDGISSTQSDAFAITIADNIPDQYAITFDLEITDGTDTWNSSFQLTVNAPYLEFGNLSIDDNAGGDGNGRLDPGETADVIIPVLNNGNSNSPLTSALLSSASGWISINSGSTNLGVINAGAGSDAVFNISCDPLTPVGTPVDLMVDVGAGNYGISNTFYTPVGLVLEDWETGNFASYPWSFAGSANWTITNVDPYEGVYCAKSGTITHNQTSELVVELYVSAADDISFYRKVSSEASYDYLRFYIDGTLQEQWAGEVAWGQVSYPVTTGAHTFKWVYYKDGSVSTGSDCAWVDYIIFPPIVPPPDPAEIALSPMSFEVTLAPDGTTVEQLNIANTGEEDLSFSLQRLYLTDDNKSKAYCTSVGGGSDEFIQNVTIGTINNTTSQSYYADYTSISTSVNVGESYPISITNGDPIWSSDQCGIWVDWNQNEDFSDDTPIVVSGTPGVGPYTATIVPPVDALGGPTRMRVQIIYAATPNPCQASFSYGEVEDYTLIVNSNFSDWLTLDPTSGTVNGSGNTNINLTFDATGLELGDYYANVIVNSNDPVNTQLIVPCTLHVAEGVLVNVKAILEGPFAGTEMTTHLNGYGMIPDDQPYNVAPWNYEGTESVAAVPNADVVDWVLVELRETAGDVTTATPATMISRKAGFILKDGSIVSTDGASPIIFDVSVTENLFTVVHHRNHLAIISATAVTMVDGSYTYDFSNGENKVYGGSLAHKMMAPGVWAMFSGDGMCDGEVDNKDKNDIWELQNNTNGYFSGDMNLDGFVDMMDNAATWKDNAGKCSHVIK
ncbi:MAG: C25 family cysteine peptidase [Bacteroidales bacterium]